MSHAHLNNLPRLTPQMKREMHHLLTEFRYVTETIVTRQQALAFRQLLNTPLKEFEKKWNFADKTEQSTCNA